MISFKSSGSFKKTENFFQKMQQKRNLGVILVKYAQYGLVALMQNTPVDSGIASSSWSYKINQNGSNFKITWFNNDTTPEGTPIVILLQYGHGTGEGGYVQGQDFINPAIKPTFDKLSRDLWEEVRNA